MTPPPTSQALLWRGATEEAPPTPITWSKHFPQQVVSLKQSLKFVQKLLALGVSNVVFLRNVFPEEAFASGKALGKIPIRILKAKNPIKEAGLLANYILSAMDALAQKYLRELHIIIHQDGDPNNVLEVYTFRSIKFLSKELKKKLYMPGSPTLRMAVSCWRWELRGKEARKLHRPASRRTPQISFGPCLTTPRGYRLCRITVTSPST